MLTRTAMMNRLNEVKELQIPIVNYGVFLAWANGLIPRALEPIEEAVLALK